MSDYVPRELLVSIFERLQMKQLGMCMVVCKSWYSIITSPDFITRNLNAVHKTQTLSWQKKIVAYDDLEKYATKHLYETCYPKKVDASKACEILGNVNGLICLSVEFFPCDPVIILWNPSIKKFLHLPTPNVTLYSHSFGFGFDECTSDFKLVRMVDFKKKVVSFELDDQVKDEFMAIEVFKLSTGKWNTMSHVHTPYQIDGKSFHAYLNGNLHWVGYGNEKAAILVFNLRTEEFWEMILPNSLFIPGKRLPKKVDVYQGSLMLVNLYEGDLGDKMGIWIMQRYGDETSWTRIYQRSLRSRILIDIGGGVDYQSLSINRQVSVSVDERHQQVTMYECRFPGENPASKGLNRVCFLCLQRGLPSIRVDICLCQSAESENVVCYMGAHFESLALLDHKGAAREEYAWKDDLQTVPPLEQSDGTVGFDLNEVKRKVKYVFGCVLNFISCNGRRVNG